MDNGSWWLMDGYLSSVAGSDLVNHGGHNLPHPWGGSRWSQDHTGCQCSFRFANEFLDQLEGQAGAWQLHVTNWSKVLLLCGPFYDYSKVIWHGNDSTWLSSTWFNSESQDSLLSLAQCESGTRYNTATSCSTNWFPSKQVTELFLVDCLAWVYP